VIGNEVARLLDEIERHIRRDERAAIAALHRKLSHAGRWRRCQACRTGNELRRASAGSLSELSQSE